VLGAPETVSPAASWHMSTLESFRHDVEEVPLIAIDPRIIAPDVRGDLRSPELPPAARLAAAGHDGGPAGRAQTAGAVGQPQARSPEGGERTGRPRRLRTCASGRETERDRDTQREGPSAPFGKKHRLHASSSDDQPPRHQRLELAGPAPVPLLRLCQRAGGLIRRRFRHG
jgi:hypothetical protein